MTLSKNEKIKETLKQTKLKRQLQRCRVIELKINTKRLGKEEFKKLNFLFTQCKWLYNYLLSLPSEELFKFNTATTKITSLDKDGKTINRELTLPAQIKQAVHQELCNNIRTLAQLKKKQHKIGKLKFKSNYDSINLKQYGKTHSIKSNNKFKIPFLKAFKVFGLKQIKNSFEIANAKLLRKESGYYILLTCYENLTKNSFKLKTNDCGLDFGIKTHITTSDGEKFNITIGENEHIKSLRKKLSRQQRGSNNSKKTIHKIRLAYEKLYNKKKDATNKLVSYLCNKYCAVYMQDEMIKGWHKRYGRCVQHSILGKVKEKLKEQKNVYIIEKHYPTTKLCHNCGSMNKNITLKDRIFVCESCGYTEDRDIKAAKTVLFIGKCKTNYTTTEHSRLSNVEK